jgi:hypothetical protein
MNRKIVFTLTLMITIISSDAFSQQKKQNDTLSAKKYNLLIILCHADDYVSIAPLLPKYA